MCWSRQRTLQSEDQLFLWLSIFSELIDIFCPCVSQTWLGLNHPGQRIHSKRSDPCLIHLGWEDQTNRQTLLSWAVSLFTLRQGPGSKSDCEMYCYHLSRILPLSGAGQCCPNMPIMTLPACISPHRTQVFHLVITPSLIHASDWLLITTLTSDWLIAQDMIRRPIAGYLNQIADNWCRVSRSVWWLWWWLWSHQGPVPAPGPSWSSYS